MDSPTTLQGPTSPVLSTSTVQVIAKNDPEYIETTNDAFIATSLATECFIKELCTEISKIIPKGQDEITYDSLSEFIATKEPFQFLREIIPQTKGLRDLVRENRVRYTVTNSAVTTTTSSSPIKAKTKTAKTIKTKTKVKTKVATTTTTTADTSTNPQPQTNTAATDEVSTSIDTNTNAVSSLPQPEFNNRTNTENSEQIAGGTPRNDIKEIVEIDINNNTDDDE